MPSSNSGHLVWMESLIKTSHASRTGSRRRQRLQPAASEAIPFQQALTGHDMPKRTKLTKLFETLWMRTRAVLWVWYWHARNNVCLPVYQELLGAVLESCVMSSILVVPWPCNRMRGASNGHKASASSHFCWHLRPLGVCFGPRLGSKKAGICPLCRHRDARRATKDSNPLHHKNKQCSPAAPSSRRAGPTMLKGPGQNAWKAASLASLPFIWLQYTSIKFVNH